MITEREKKIYGTIIFAFVFSLYTKTAYRSVAGGDSGELVAQSCRLGVAHPPGVRDTLAFDAKHHTHPHTQITVSFIPNDKLYSNERIDISRWITCIQIEFSELRARRRLCHSVFSQRRDVDVPNRCVRTFCRYGKCIHVCRITTHMDVCN